MADNCSCSCESGGTRLLYTCSGASDVGELADRAVRVLWNDGFAQKSCLAGVGADLSGFVKSAEGADLNITVDGCPLLCAKKNLERVGVKPLSIMLGDLGFSKGACNVDEAAVEKAVSEIKEKFKS